MIGLIFDIQHFSIYDGPGIRTTVFMKGCSLNCEWCHNPESIKSKKEVQTYFFKCIGCGRCFEVCPQGAHEIIGSERFYDREICLSCGKCTGSCYSGALVMTGREMTLEEVIEEVSRDLPFYSDSKGGVTFSGGEPLLQSKFVSEAMRICRENGIHTAVDTAGNIPYNAIEEVVPYTDLFLYDIKAMDSDVHKKYTGADNGKILANLSRLSKTGVPIRIRIPVIPGVNASMSEMVGIADFLTGMNNIEAVEPLAYHSLGAGKLESMGRVGDKTVFSVPEKKTMIEFYELFESRGLKVIRKPG